MDSATFTRNNLRRNASYFQAERLIGVSWLTISMRRFFAFLKVGKRCDISPSDK